MLDCCKENDGFPCCDMTTCEADPLDKISPELGDISNCLHCGGELEYWNNGWYHHSQMELPEDERNEPQDR